MISVALYFLQPLRPIRNSFPGFVLIVVVIFGSEAISSEPKMKSQRRQTNEMNEKNIFIQLLAFYTILYYYYCIFCVLCVFVYLLSAPCHLPHFEYDTLSNFLNELINKRLKRTTELKYKILTVRFKRSTMHCTISSAVVCFEASTLSAS